MFKYPAMILAFLVVVFPDYFIPAKIIHINFYSYTLIRRCLMY
jgi:hypothetical protein